MATVKSLQTALNRVVDFLPINEAHKTELRELIGETESATETEETPTE